MKIIHVYAHPSLRNTYFIDLQTFSAARLEFLTLTTNAGHHFSPQLSH